ncbi:Condensin complex subunit 1 [Lamellibrachia satsuma]|nr:Condensin complex subunit 1 [Lamellibrachia satsuma]
MMPTLPDTLLKGELDEMLPTLPDTPLKGELDEMMPTLPNAPLKGELDEMVPTLPDTPLKGELDEMMPTLPNAPLKGELDEMMPTLPNAPLKGELDEMMPTLPNAPLKDPAQLESEEKWTGMKEKLMEAVTTVLEELTGDKKADQSENIADTDDLPSVCKHLVGLLGEDNYPRAVILFLAAGETWPNEAVFKYKPDEQNEEEEEEDEDGVAIRLLQKLRQIFLGGSHETELEKAVAQASSSLTEASTQDTGLVNELTKQQVLVQYLKDSTHFAGEIEKAVPVVCQLLGSRVTTDVQEAINFFVSSFEFGVSHAIVGVRQMLALVWSKEPTIKESVVNAYKRLYLKSEGNATSRAGTLSVANNLLQLAVRADLGELTSLEQLVCELVKSGDLDHGVIQVLWEKFAQKIGNTSIMESRGALLLLGMAATAEVEIVRSNIDVLVKEGLGPRAEQDYGLAADTCTVLLKLAGKHKAKVGSTVKPYKFPQQHKIFERLSHLIITGVSRLELCQWIPMAEQAVCVIYRLAEHPDCICTNIIKHVAETAMNYHQQGEPPEASQTTPEEGPESASQPVASQEFTCPPAMLTRLLSLLGHVALRQLVHLDVSIFGEMKRRHQLQEDSSKKKTPSSARKTPRSEVGQASVEEDLGMTGAVAEDAEAEFIRRVTEEELVTGNNLLAVLSPVITAVCNNPTKYCDERLQAAASLALAKYMLVSSEFCEKHLQLLFTILEKSPNPVIRANTIITLGDLTFRFPNLIQPWTPNLYARLRDDSPQVRKNTLMVLTHLILNDMVKVKGQISELATCIIDDDVRIASLAKLFFNELSKKGNAIYNIMADIISRLSDPDVGVAEEDFRIIMRFLFSFIQKDKQCESLVEKLCHRFRATQ